MRSLVVIAEGGKKIGMGHIVRQFALCQLLNIQHKVTAYVQSDWTNEEASAMDFFFDTFHLVTDVFNVLEQIPSGSLVFMDGYNFDIDKINRTKRMKEWKMIFVADIHKEVPDCDVLINHLPWIKNNDYANATILKKLLGPKYAILREPFYSREKIAEQNRALICLGGSDIEKQIGRIYTALNTHGLSEDQIDVLYNKPIKGGSIKNLHYNLKAEQVYSLISKARICFITPGNISYEVFSINRAAVMGYISEEQKVIVDRFSKMRLCFNVGDWNLANFKNILIWIKEAESTKNVQASFFNNLEFNNIKNELSSYVN